MGRLIVAYLLIGVGVGFLVIDGIPTSFNFKSLLYPIYGITCIMAGISELRKAKINIEKSKDE